MKLHRLLKRQIKNNFGSIDNIPKEMTAFIQSINQSYSHYESDRELLENTMNVNSKELTESNSLLKSVADSQSKLLENLKQSVNELRSNKNDNLEDVQIENIGDIIQQEIRIKNQYELNLEKSRKELRTSEKQHRLLFEENPTPMLIYSIESMRILAVNDLVISKYGYSQQEFMDKTIMDLHHDVDLEEVHNYTIDAVKGRNKVSEWIHVLKDKSEINVQLIAKSIQYNNEHALLVSINDITALKRYQNELIAAKQVAEKSKDLQSQFLSNMSHEIRTPMNGILGITRILQDTEIDGEQRHYLNAIIQSSENLMVIINDILDFSKIEAGKIEIEKTRFNLDELLIVVQEILIVEAQKKGLYLRLDKAEEVPAWLEGDPVRLNQILMNLLGNAIKFTEKGGVTVKVELTSSDDDNAKLVFKIIDTGIGIPENKKNTIFQSFTQASSSTARTHGGTGLGLTITKQLIELQDGEIWIESEENKGSSFNFEIEYKKSKKTEETELVLQMNEKKSSKKMLDELKGSRILLVEDHPINQMLTIKVLEDWGFNVDLAENGQIALNKLQENDNYALILMDINMPVMDGYTTTREIRSGDYTSNKEIPIVAMTASAFIGENQKCYKAGMNDYISKPFNPQVLLAKITNHINNYLKSA